MHRTISMKTIQLSTFMKLTTDARIAYEVIIYLYGSGAVHLGPSAKNVVKIAPMTYVRDDPGCLEDGWKTGPKECKSSVHWAALFHLIFRQT